MRPPPEFSEQRRSFVKKSLATSVSISFAGLIRAHGEGSGDTTTSNPWGETTLATTEGSTETWATTASTVETTSPWGEETTVGPTTEETTIATTAGKKIRYKSHKITLWLKDFSNNNWWSTSYSDAVRSTLEPPPPPVAVSPPPPMVVGSVIPHDPSLDVYINTNGALVSGPDYLSSTKVVSAVAAPGGGHFWKCEIVVTYQYTYA